MKFFITDLLSKCDQIRRKLQIWLHLLKKSVMENFIFCGVYWASLIQCIRTKTQLILHDIIAALN